MLQQDENGGGGSEESLSHGVMGSERDGIGQEDSYLMMQWNNSLYEQRDTHTQRIFFLTITYVCGW